MANVLVTYGSKLGGTEGIAEWISDTLRSHGHIVTCIDADRLRDVSGYDAVVAGSSLYGGRWRRPVVTVLQRLGRLPASPPVWLFHSGPLGDELAGEAQVYPANVEAATAHLDVRDRVTFGGRLDGDPPGWIASKMAQNGKAGDWRDETEIRAWARSIAEQLALLTMGV